MDISSVRLAKLSPSGDFIVSAFSTQVSIRNASSLEVVQEFTCLGACETLAWSPDSELIMVGILKRGSIQIFCPSQPEFRCKISEGCAGIVASMWGPDSRHLVTFADFNLHATVWNLSDSKTLVIPKPKDHLTFCWNREGSRLAVATREQSKDVVNVVECDGLKTCITFPVATLDCTALEWAPGDGAIVVQDTCLRYLVLIYSSHTGELRARYSAYDQALGLKALSWSPCGAYLALASYDQSVRLLNALTWEPAVQYTHTHPKLLPASAKCPVVALWIENAEPPDGTAPSFSQVFDMDMFPVPVVPVDESALQPKVGVGICQWSLDGRFMATRNDNMPLVLWVWDVAVGSGLHSAILLQNPVRCVRWSPIEHLLVIATGGAALYFWSPGSGIRASTGSNLGPSGVTVVQWAASGADLLAVSSTKCSLVTKA